MFIDVNAYTEEGLVTVLTWIKDNIGDNGWRWDFLTVAAGTPYLVRFDFDNEKDATIFTLRWI